jgi:polysaccharide biosynthesis protein PslG
MAGARPVRQSRCALGLLVAVLALASGCGSSTSSTGAASPSFYGIVPYGPLDGGDFNRMQAAGVGSLRFLIQWPAVQASPDAPFDFSATDALVAEAARHHMTMLATLSDTPSFVQPPCTGDRCGVKLPVQTKAQRAGWERFVRAAAARYGSGGSYWRSNPDLPPDPITRWEIWNEENNPDQGNPARRYAKLLALSDRAIKSVDPRAQIIVGGMFGTPIGFRRPGVTAWSYLNLLYRAGAAKDFDGVALHPYSRTLAGIRYQIERIREVMKARGDAATPILITEIGWGSGAGVHHAGTGSRGQTFVVTPPQQAKKLTASYELLNSHRESWRIGGVYWFTWKDPLNPPPGLCAFCYSSGLYHADGRTPKPALSAFETFTRHASS